MDVSGSYSRLAEFQSPRADNERCSGLDYNYLLNDEWVKGEQSVWKCVQVHSDDAAQHGEPETFDPPQEAESIDTLLGEVGDTLRTIPLTQAALLPYVVESCKATVNMAVALYHHQYEDTKKRIQELEAQASEIGRLEASKEKVRGLWAEKDLTEKALAAARKEVTDMANTITILKGRLKASQEEVRELQASKNLTDKVLAAARKEATDMAKKFTNAIHEAQAEIQAKSKALLEEQVLVNTLREELVEANTAQQGEVEALREELSRANTRATDALAEAKTQATYFETQQGVVQALREELSQANTRVTDALAEAKTQATYSETQKGVVQALREELSQANTLATDREAQLKAEMLVEANSHAAYLEAQQGVVQALREELSLAKTQATNREAQHKADGLAEAKTRAAYLDSHQGAVQALKRELAQANTRVANLEAKLEADAIAHTYTQKAYLDGQYCMVQAFREQLAQANARTAALEAQLKKNALTKTNTRAAQGVVEALREELAQLNSEAERIPIEALSASQRANPGTDAPCREDNNPTEILADFETNQRAAEAEAVETTTKSNEEVITEVENLQGVKGARAPRAPYARSSSRVSKCKARGKRVLLELDDIRKYYDAPIKEAAEKLGVGATRLRKRCRELNITRWPHRKFRSLDTLISETEKNGLPSRHIRMLEKQKRQIMQEPNSELDDKALRLRRTAYNAKHTNNKRSRFANV